MQDKNKENKDTLAAFAHRLGVLAGRTRLKQVDIARALKATPQRVGGWFQGRNFPGGDIEYALADLLGTTRDWLIEGKENTETIDAHGGPLGLPLKPSVIEGELAQRIRIRVEELIAAAGEDPTRLGWIYEQLQAHLSPPAHWVNHETEVAKAKRLMKNLVDESQRERAPNQREHAS